ncbi:MAG: hypothetical protein KGS45_00150 [Planctomycetes bacterium]|nr:hypothetical protein [Planctomycetota bacterium]
MGPLAWGILGTLALALTIVLVVVFVVYVFIPMGKGLRYLGLHIFRYLKNTIVDSLKAIGALVMATFCLTGATFALILARLESARHYRDEFTRELGVIGKCLYRVLIGHPLRLVGLGPALDSVESRLPDVIARSPGASAKAGNASPGRTRQFDGYTIVATLKGGGSGARLYVAQPDDTQREIFRRSGAGEVDRVVIKCFTFGDGMGVPELRRETRALDAARDLGLVLADVDEPERFYYVTRFVPGDRLNRVVMRLHETSGEEGLHGDQLVLAMSLVADLLRTLDRYHKGGLWHKDVKPDNIIVNEEADTAVAHLVDLGLVTSLHSGLTLTTHGTEYFRDPELVRQALRGTKVDKIDGARFDVYAAGAVLYSVLENSFPAHGSLSRFTRKSPDCLRWIVQRAMTDYDKRYRSVAIMLADLEWVASQPDPFAAKPAQMPSMRDAMEEGDLPPLTALESSEGAAPSVTVIVNDEPEVPPSETATLDDHISASHSGKGIPGLLSGSGSPLIPKAPTVVQPVARPMAKAITASIATPALGALETKGSASRGLRTGLATATTAKTTAKSAPSTRRAARRTAVMATVVIGAAMGLGIYIGQVLKPSLPSAEVESATTATSLDLSSDAQAALLPSALGPEASARAALAALQRTQQAKIAGELARFISRQARVISDASGLTAPETKATVAMSPEEEELRARNAEVIASPISVSTPSSLFTLAEEFRRAMGDSPKSARVAIVCDFTTPLTAEQESAVAFPLLGLLWSDIDLIGRYPNNPVKGDALREHRALVSALSAIAAPVGPSAATTKQAVAQWLVSNPRYDAAIFVHQPRSRSGQAPAFEFVVVSPTLDDLDDRRRERVVEVLRRVVTSLSPTRMNKKS